METFRRNVWINPFWEDDVSDVISLMGTDHVLFGSDWPHAEGLTNPLDYLTELNELSDADRDKIMRDNVTELTRLQPA